MTEEEKKELERQQAELTRAQRLAAAHEQAVQETNAIGNQAIEDIQNATQQFIDTSNADQQAYKDVMTGLRTDWQNKMDASVGGVEAIIKEGEARLQREREIAQAEYLASQRAAQGTGLAHLASSIANLIGVGGFNASSQVYENPSVDWMRKADQDKQIARQRLDNLRDRQRQIQMHQLELQMNIANQAYGMDSALAGQDLEHRRGVANAQYQGARDVSNVRMQTGQQATQYGLAGTTAQVNAEYQDAQLAEQRRYREEQAQIQREQYAAQNAINMARYGLQQDPETGAITPIINPATGLPVGNVSGRSSSGSGSSTSGNNYKVTVDGKEIVLGMNKETYTTAIQSGKKAIQQDVMDEAGFKGTWDEFVDAASSKKIKQNGKRVANPLFKYADLIEALENNGNTLDSDEAKRITAIIEDYVTKNSDTTNNFNKHLMDVSNRQTILREQAAAVNSQTPSQQPDQETPAAPADSTARRVPPQPTRETVIDGHRVTVDNNTGEILYRGGPASGVGSASEDWKMWNKE